MSRLTAVGCGPGDPDLLTVKAVNAIKTADVILCPKSKDDRPSIALSVVSKLVGKKTRIVEMVFPMTKDKDVLEQTWEKNAEIMAKTETPLVNRECRVHNCGRSVLFTAHGYT